MIERKKGGDSLTSSADSACQRLNSVSEDADDFMLAVNYVKDKDMEKINMQLNDMYICACTDFLLSVMDFFVKNKPVVAVDETEKLVQKEKDVMAPLEPIQEEEEQFAGLQSQRFPADCLKFFRIVHWTNSQFQTWR